MVYRLDKQTADYYYNPKRPRLFGNLDRDSMPRLEALIERVVERATLFFISDIFIKVGRWQILWITKYSANVGGTAG